MKNYSKSMEQQKKNLRKHLAIFLFMFIPTTFLYSSVWWADDIASSFSPQSSTWSWSFNSVVSVDSDLKYVNKGNNSSVIGNYFTWYYYNSVWWYFKTNWATTSNQNVRITGSTDSCNNSYGYKLWGYAYSEYHGFVDFDYSDSIFVYYCVANKLLYWYAYSEDLWFQNLEGITFDIDVTPSTIIEEPEWDENFYNDDTTIADRWNSSSSSTSGSSSSSTSSSSTSGSSSSSGWFFISADTIEFEAIEETLFYIIK